MADLPDREFWDSLAESIAERVVQRIEHREQVNSLANQVIELLLERSPYEGSITMETARTRAERVIKSLQPYPGGLEGRGIVICGGGPVYFTNAWVNIRALRHVGCSLPIQLWHRGVGEIDSQMRALVAPYGVQCVDALEVREKHPARILRGWETKPYSIIHSPFEEVLFLDADTCPVADPTYLFDTPRYQDTGAIMWPDIRNMPANHRAWRVFGVDYRDEPEAEGGHLLLNKARCWEALTLTMWYNEYSDFFYQIVYGDKDLTRMAFHKLGKPYAMPDRVIYDDAGVLYQHDFAGNRLFQHRVGAKWSILEENKRIPGFLLEDQCLEFLDDLRSRWGGVPGASGTNVTGGSNGKLPPLIEAVPAGA